MVHVMLEGRTNALPCLHAFNTFPCCKIGCWWASVAFIACVTWSEPWRKREAGWGTSSALRCSRGRPYSARHARGDEPRPSDDDGEEEEDDEEEEEEEGGGGGGGEDDDDDDNDDNDDHFLQALTAAAQGVLGESPWRAEAREGKVRTQTTAEPNRSATTKRDAHPSVLQPSPLLLGDAAGVSLSCEWMATWLSSGLVDGEEVASHGVVWTESREFAGRRGSD